MTYYNKALAMIRQWDYNTDSPIALGIFYKKAMPTFEDRFVRSSAGPVDRQAKIKDFLNNSI